MALKTCCLVTIVVALVTVVVAVALVIATVALVDKGKEVEVSQTDEECALDYCFKSGDDAFCRENYNRI